MVSSDIFNFITVNDVVATGGQPTAEQFEALAAEGFAVVVNLAPVDPADPVADEAGLVASLGMVYHHIPVEWDEPKDADFEAFEQTMLELPEGKVFIHCVANFRVTAFYSLYALKHLGWSQAQAEGLRAMIWEGEEYPVWREFVARWQARIVAG